MTTLERPSSHKLGTEKSLYREKDKFVSRKENQIYAAIYSSSFSPPKKEFEKVTWIIPKLNIELSGKTFILDRNLDKIYDCIINSKKILQLKDDWDDEGALACNKITYNRAIELLLKYTLHLFETYNLIIEEPEINLVKDGSIDLEWRNNSSILLFNILNKPERDIHYYGEDFKSKTIIKGFIDYDHINNDLAYWMQKLE